MNRIRPGFRRSASKVDGDVHGLYTEVFDIPATAHYIGGCVIGDSPRTGIINPHQRVYGHPGCMWPTGRPSPPTSA